MNDSFMIARWEAENISCKHFESRAQYLKVGQDRTAVNMYHRYEGEGNYLKLGKI